MTITLIGTPGMERPDDNNEITVKLILSANPHPLWVEAFNTAMLGHPAARQPARWGIDGAEIWFTVPADDSADAAWAFADERTEDSDFYRSLTLIRECINEANIASEIDRNDDGPDPNF